MSKEFVHAKQFLYLNREKSSICILFSLSLNKTLLCYSIYKWHTNIYKKCLIYVWIYRYRNMVKMEYRTIVASLSACLRLWTTCKQMYYCREQ